MSERVRESIIASLLASKRFIVSVCAAIAMILGAMSAGASVFTGTSTAEPQQVAAVFSEAPRTSPATSQAKETTLFSQRSTLHSQSVAVQTPLYAIADTSPAKEKKGLNLKLNQDVVKAASSALFYNPVTPAEKPDTAQAVTQPDQSIPAESEETVEEPAAATVEPEDPATPTPADPTPQPSDPTIEPGMNSRAAPNPEETQ